MTIKIRTDRGKGETREREEENGERGGKQGVREIWRGGERDRDTDGEWLERMRDEGGG